MNAPTAKPFRWIFPPPVVAASWVICCGVVDWLSGSELAASAFYLPGICIAAWFSGRVAGVLIALFAAAVWLTAELAWQVPYSHPLVPYWNALVRILIFAVTGLLTSEVRIRQKIETDLRKQKDILASILNSMGDGVIVVDDDDHFLAFNPAAARWFPAPAEDVPASDWLTVNERFFTRGWEREDEHPIELAVTGKFAGYAEIALPDGDRDGPRLLGLTALPLVGGRGTVLVITDLTERRELERQISQASEREQRRIGHDLHDGVCQHLVGIGFAAATLQNQLANQGQSAEADAAGEIAGLIRDASRQARDLARGLYPAGLEEGLEIALQTLAKLVQERSGIPCRFHGTANLPDDLPPDTAAHVYRIVQEALTNAVRHAAPSHLTVRLRGDGARLAVEIEDDGCGFREPDPANRGIGLQIMNYRANLIGGRLVIHALPQGGTRVTCSLRARRPKTSPLGRE